MKQFFDSGIKNFLRVIIAILLIFFVLWTIVFLLVQKTTFKKKQKLLLGIYFILFTLWFFWVAIYSPDGFDSLPENIFSINISSIRNHLSTFSENNTPNIYEKLFSKKRGLAQQVNIIVVFAESLSPIDSLAVGKVNNNLPYFDLIQKDGITFTNFVNNWCTSDTAHIWFFLGVEPIKMIGQSVWAYSGYKNFTDALPLFLNKQWYSSTFVSAVDVDFLWQRAFLSEAWFTKIIGEEAFEDKQKYVFDAAPDHDLYNKTLETIDEQTGKYFIALQSISFHKPYYTPYGDTQKDAIRYADKSLYYFYLQLKKSWFFDDGILVIMTDHRKMEALESGEQEALGDFWRTKGVATVVGTGITPGTLHTNITQHTDFFYSLKQLTSKWLVTVSKVFNDTFSVDIKRDRGIIYCRYFQKKNKYAIVQESNSGFAFNDISQIAKRYSFVYKYMTSYIAFQQNSWTIQNNWTDMVIIAHQWSPVETPENSIEWFLLAKKNWADGIELDVSYTKDKHNLVLHGDRMYHTVCGRDYIVGNHTLEDLKTNCPLNNWEELQTLEEVLKTLDGVFNYYFIDIKVYNTKYTQEQIQDVIETVKKLGMEDRAILSSYDKEANTLLWADTGIIAWRDTFDSNDVFSLHEANHKYFMLPYSSITWNLSQEVEDIGKIFVSYTVNTTGDLEQLYNQWIRIIMTDNVPLMKTWAENNLGK